MGWREDRKFEYMNRGLETRIQMTKVRELPGQFRVRAWERFLGGMTTQTHESVSFEDEARAMFNHYVEQAMLTDYEPEPVGNHPKLKHTDPVAHADLVQAGMAETAIKQKETDSG